MPNKKRRQRENLYGKDNRNQSEHQPQGPQSSQYSKAHTRQNLDPPNAFTSNAWSGQSSFASSAKSYSSSVNSNAWGRKTSENWDDDPVPYQSSASSYAGVMREASPSENFWKKRQEFYQSAVPKDETDEEKMLQAALELSRLELQEQSLRAKFDKEEEEERRKKTEEIKASTFTHEENVYEPPPFQDSYPPMENTWGISFAQAIKSNASSQKLHKPLVQVDKPTDSVGNNDTADVHSFIRETDPNDDFDWDKIPGEDEFGEKVIAKPMLNTAVGQTATTSEEFQQEESEESDFDWDFIPGEDEFGENANKNKQTSLKEQSNHQLQGELDSKGSTLTKGFGRGRFHNARKDTNLVGSPLFQEKNTEKEIYLSDSDSEDVSDDYTHGDGGGSVGYSHNQDLTAQRANGTKSHSLTKFMGLDHVSEEGLSIANTNSWKTNRTEQLVAADLQERMKGSEQEHSYKIPSGKGLGLDVHSNVSASFPSSQSYTSGSMHGHIETETALGSVFSAPIKYENDYTSQRLYNNQTETAYGNVMNDHHSTSNAQSQQLSSDIFSRYLPPSPKVESDETTPNNAVISSNTCDSLDQNPYVPSSNTTNTFHNADTPGFGYSDTDFPQKTFSTFSSQLPTTNQSTRSAGHAIGLSDALPDTNTHQGFASTNNIYANRSTDKGSTSQDTHSYRRYGPRLYQQNVSDKNRKLNTYSSSSTPTNSAGTFNKMNYYNESGSHSSSETVHHGTLVQDQGVTETRGNNSDSIYSNNRMHQLQQNPGYPIKNSHVNDEKERYTSQNKQSSENASVNKDINSNNQFQGSSLPNDINSYLGYSHPYMNQQLPVMQAGMQQYQLAAYANMPYMGGNSAWTGAPSTTEVSSHGMSVPMQNNMMPFYPMMPYNMVPSVGGVLPLQTMPGFHETNINPFVGSDNISGSVSTGSRTSSPADESNTTQRIGHVSNPPGFQMDGMGNSSKEMPQMNPQQAMGNSYFYSMPMMPGTYPYMQMQLVRPQSDSKP